MLGTAVARIVASMAMSPVASMRAASTGPRSDLSPMEARSTEAVTTGSSRSSAVVFRRLACGVCVGLAGGLRCGLVVRLVVVQNRAVDGLRDGRRVDGQDQHRE